MKLGVAFAAAAAIALTVWLTMLKPPTEKSAKIVLAGSIPEGNLSPENISTIALYHLHYNLWDTLVGPRNSSALAKSFQVSPDNKTYSFSLQPFAKFSNGRQVTADDVRGSLARLIAREENGHINAKSAIKEIRGIDDFTLEIELNHPTPSFLFLLATPEFGIVPKESLDANGNVTNLTVTSGAYTAEKIDVLAQTISLKRNPNFSRAVTGSSEMINLTFVKNPELGPATLSSDADFIETRSFDNPTFLQDALKAGYKYNITAPSISVFMASNPKLLSEKGAIAVASLLGKEFNFRDSEHEYRSHQLFPPKTFGSLQKPEIPSLEYAKEDLPKKLVIKISRASGTIVDELKKVFSSSGVELRFIEWASKEPHHYWLFSQGMNTEFPEIELHLVALSPYAMFDIGKASGDALRKATHEPEDSKRSELVRQIGKSVLETGRIVPFTVRSYGHIYNPAKVDIGNLTNYDGDIPFYQIRLAE